MASIEVEPPDSGMWRMRDGKQIAIKDMSDSHLFNTIAMLARGCKRVQQEHIEAAQEMQDMLQGDMSQSIAASALDQSMGSWTQFAPPVFHDLANEFFNVRGLKLEQFSKRKPA